MDPTKYVPRSSYHELKTQLGDVKHFVNLNKGYSHIIDLLSLYRKFIDASSKNNLEECKSILEQTKLVVAHLKSADRGYDFVVKNFKLVYNDQIDMNNVFINYVKKLFHWN